eukprot:c842_g1_i1.p1 GENE.c842_g1_i1~~c842_g1_i1.p1  ORF type:complete len:176 (+),score=20.66 c842_g1_i1:1568-2095(+)
MLCQRFQLKPDRDPIARWVARLPPHTQLEQGCQIFGFGIHYPFVSSDRLALHPAFLDLVQHQSTTSSPRAHFLHCGKDTNSPFDYLILVQMTKICHILIGDAKFSSQNTITANLIIPILEAIACFVSLLQNAGFTVQEILPFILTNTDVATFQKDSNNKIDQKLACLPSSLSWSS